MAFQVAEYSYELIEILQPLVQRIRARDRSLADQLTRAASSIVLNIAEGDVSDPGTQRSRFFTAAGSASETRAALRVAAGWRYIAVSEADRAHALLNRIIAILWKLTHR
jgi:four helix bundle protein